MTSLIILITPPFSVLNLCRIQCLQGDFSFGAKDICEVFQWIGMMLDVAGVPSEEGPQGGMQQEEEQRGR
jgi:hypothetical protein